MIGQVLRENHEGHGGIGHEDRQQIRCVHAAPVRLREAELRQGNEGLHGGQGRIVDHDEGGVAGGAADDREDGGAGIARQDADDEGDQTAELLRVGRAEHDHRQGHEAADERHIGGAALHAGAHEIAHGVARQGQADDGHRGPDDDGRHQLVDPLDAAELYNDGDDDIYKAGDQRADDKPGIAHGHGGGAAEGREHGAQEREGAAQEHGAGALGEQQIHDGADAGAEESRGGGHIAAGNAVDDRGHCDGRSHDRKQLLDGEQNDLTELGLVFDSVDQVHSLSPFSVLFFN